MIPEVVLKQNRVPEILREVWAQWQGEESDFSRKLHRYYLACGRAIWKLLVKKESRKGIIVGEKYLKGKVTFNQILEQDYYTEGAAFDFSFNLSPDEIAARVAKIELLPKAELEAILHPAAALKYLSVRELLTKAAYFASFALMGGAISTDEEPEFVVPADYVIFLSQPLLYEIFGNPLQFQ